MIAEIEKTIDVRANYATVHALKAIMLIGQDNTGREKLMDKLGLNEAPARTLLASLEKNRFVKPTRKGHVLTKKGESIFTLLKKNISGPKRMGKTGITLSRYNIAYLVRNRSHKIKHGLEQRDQAILMGADGLTTLIYDGRLRMAGVKWHVPKDLSKEFDYKNGDVLLIGSAKNEKTAEFAALNAALRLLH